jgi:hypothetical protein
MRRSSEQPTVQSAIENQAMIEVFGIYELLESVIVVERDVEKEAKRPTVILTKEKPPGLTSQELAALRDAGWFVIIATVLERSTREPVRKHDEEFVTRLERGALSR